MTDLTTQTPADIDTQWAEELQTLAPLEMKLASKQSSAKYSRKEAARVKNNEAWAAREIADAEKAEAEAAELRDELRAKRDEINAPFDAEWNTRGGWERAYIVTNTNGHIHHTTGCGTCFPTTQFHWMTQLSGLNRAEVADLAGERACTVCYPDAPVDKPSQLFTPDEEAKKAAKAERAAKKAAKDAKKAAAAITDVDGTPLTFRQFNRDEVLKTERTARIQLTDSMVNAITYTGRSDNADTAEESERFAGFAHEHGMNVEKILKAVAHKTGENPEDIRTAHTKKAEAKMRKDQRYAEKMGWV